MKKRMAWILVLALCLTGCGGQTRRPAAPTEDTTIPPETTEPVTAAEVTVSEVMSDNKKQTLGHDLDWVELYNREEIPVTLDGYCLTDDTTTAGSMDLSGMTIPAGGYLTVVLEEDAPFHLSADGETVYLLFGSEVVSQVAFGLSEDGESFDAEGTLPWPTPGYANTEEGYLAYLEGLELPELIISEVMSSNSQYLKTGGEYYDWVEVTNSSGGPLSLSGYTLTDKRSEPQRYAFPDVTLQSGESYVVLCSDDASPGENHAPFKISASGETVYIARDGKITDALTVPSDLQRNERYGRDGKLPSYMETPTPGQPNSAGYRSAVAAPAASSPSGIYPDTVQISLTGEGTIYYTTDGSRPTVRSRVYTEPITIRQMATIRTLCVSGERTSPIAAYTYLIGAEHDLPVVSVAIPQKSLTGSTGVLNHIENDYEHEAVLTLIEDGEEKFSVPCGFRLHGNDSRKGAKQNFQLRFRSEYGVGKLNYPLFPEREFGEYNSLLLKGGSEDWNNSVIRDELATSLAEGSAVYTQAMKPVVLYLGDEYWGVYYLRERFSDDYVASHLGVSQESVNLLYSSGGYVQSGSAADFKALKKYVQSHDMTKTENYEYLTARIDVQSLMDWYIFRSYVGDKDIANIRRFNSTEGDGKWRWMYFDLDWSFWHTTDKPFSGIMKSGAENALMKAVLKNPEGRDAFLKRYAYWMDTVLNEQYVTAAIDSMVSQIASEMPADRERWGRTMGQWESKVQVLRNYVKDGKRNQRVLEDLQDYFDLSDQEMTEYFG